MQPRHEQSISTRVPCSQTHFLSLPLTSGSHESVLQFYNFVISRIGCEVDITQNKIVQYVTCGTFSLTQPSPLEIRPGPERVGGLLLFPAEKCPRVGVGGAQLCNPLRAPAQFSAVGHYEWSCYKHPCAGFCVNPGFRFSETSARVQRRVEYELCACLLRDCGCTILYSHQQCLAAQVICALASTWYCHCFYVGCCGGCGRAP